MGNSVEVLCTGQGWGKYFELTAVPPEILVCGGLAYGKTELCALGGDILCPDLRPCHECSCRCPLTCIGLGITLSDKCLTLLGTRKKAKIRYGVR